MNGLLHAPTRASCSRVPGASSTESCSVEVGGRDRTATGRIPDPPGVPPQSLGAGAGIEPASPGYEPGTEPPRLHRSHARAPHTTTPPSSATHGAGHPQPTTHRTRPYIRTSTDPAFRRTTDRRTQAPRVSSSCPGRGWDSISGPRSAITAPTREVERTQHCRGHSTLLSLDALATRQDHRTGRGPAESHPPSSPERPAALAPLGCPPAPMNPSQGSHASTDPCSLSRALPTPPPRASPAWDPLHLPGTPPHPLHPRARTALAALPPTTRHASTVTPSAPNTPRPDSTLPHATRSPPEPSSAR